MRVSDDAQEIYDGLRRVKIQPDVVTYTHLLAVMERVGRAGEALRIFREGVGSGQLMNQRLDSLWERDISRLSYQLVRVAVDYALGEVLQRFREAQARGEWDDAEAEDLQLITGIDVPKEHEAQHTAQTRQDLALQVLEEYGIGASVDDDNPGVVRVRKEPLLRWLRKEGSR
jgi:hypothetical protein